MCQLLPGPITAAADGRHGGNLEIDLIGGDSCQHSGSYAKPRSRDFAIRGAPDEFLRTCRIEGSRHQISQTVAWCTKEPASIRPLAQILDKRIPQASARIP
jgi:hypothetical protein